MEKSWFQSKTMLAGIVTSLLGASGLAFNIDLATGDFSGNFYQIWQQLGTLIAGFAVMYGRSVATAPIKPLRKSK